MRKVIRLVAALICVSVIFSACDTKEKKKRKHHKEKDETVVTTFIDDNRDMYSDDILVGYSLSGAGYGTYYECLSATVKVYTDRTVVVTMNMDGNPEAGSFQLSEDDYKKLEEIINPDEIANLEVEEDMEVCDGNCNYLYVYLKDNTTVSVGGYMPEGARFWEIMTEIREVMEPYNVRGIKAEYVDMLIENNIEIEY